MTKAMRLLACWRQAFEFMVKCHERQDGADCLYGQQGSQVCNSTKQLTIARVTMIHAKTYKHSTPKNDNVAIHETKNLIEFQLMDNVWLASSQATKNSTT